MLNPQQTTISRRGVLRGIGAALTLPLLHSTASAQQSAPELWYWQNAFPQSPADVSALEARIDEAIGYGYTGVAFWSSAFTYMGSVVHPANNVAYMRQMISYAQSKGMKTMGTTNPYGYSDDALLNNPNWAEGQQLIGSRFVVNAAQTALVPVNGFGGLVNPGFEEGTSGWFAYNDSGMGIDSSVAHGGGASGYVRNATGNARFGQTLQVLPWRQYHVRIWIRTQDFRGFAQIEVWDPPTNTICFNTPIGRQSTQDWTALEFTFNSRATSRPSLLFGVWGGCSGSIWFDDVFVEETSLVNVLRRPGTPLRVYDPGNPGRVFQEGADFDPIADPQVAPGKFISGFYHPPVTVTLPQGTMLQPGQTVAMDYYAVQPAQAGGDVGMCLTETGAQDWLQQNTRALLENMPGGMGWLLSYDEMRHMNSCASCKAKNLTAGQLLAWHVGNTGSLVQSLAPSAPLYIWSDMFDPWHNAVDNYYFVEGNIAGSWAGLPPGVTMLNWNLQSLRNSLTWFSGLDAQQPVPYRQIIAGYYDSGDGGGAAAQELQQAGGIPGVAGLMYTTWANDYSQLQSFAAAAKSNWAAYLSSVVKDLTGQFHSSASAVTLSRATGRYSQTVKLTNGGGAVASAALVLDSLPAGVALYQPDGATSAALPAGSPFREIGPVGAGATVTLTLQFTRTGTPAITYTARVLGPGPR